MCFNIAIVTTAKQKYTERYKHVAPVHQETNAVTNELTPYYFVSGFAHPSLPVVTHNGIFSYEWGLIPFWIKDKSAANDIKTKTLNAVGETVFEKPSFRKSILSQRCLLPVNAFFEWRDVNKVKYPYCIASKENELFSLGCIYDTWTDLSTGEIVNTFSILTTEANPLMEKIHNQKKRMPLMLKVEDEAKWLDSSLSKESLQKLIKPFDENLMKAYSITRDANSSKVDRNYPEILEPVVYQELD